MKLAKTTLDAVLKTGGEFFHDWTEPARRSRSVDRRRRGHDRALHRRHARGHAHRGQPVRRSSRCCATSWLEVTGGMRYDWYGLQGDGRMRIGSISNPAGVRPSTTALYTNFETDRHNGSMSPRMSIAVKPVEQLQLFANIGRSMRPPAHHRDAAVGPARGQPVPVLPQPRPARRVLAQHRTGRERGLQGPADRA
jgi:heme acquisition protein HasR